MDATDEDRPAGAEDWAAVARAALAEHITGTWRGRKLRRRLLTDMLEDLAAGKPLELVARKHGILPLTVRNWADNRPAAWQAIEHARSIGEELHLAKIYAANDWRAADRALAICRPEYAPQSAGVNPGQTAIQVIVNIPVPIGLEAGESARVVELAAPHTQAVDSAPADVMANPAK